MIDLDLFLPRDAMLSAVYAVVVFLSVCVSVTLRYCIKSAKRRITQIMPQDSSFLTPKLTAKFERDTPYSGDKCRWGGLKFANFDKKRAIT